ncbi:MAG: hypothetical protein ABGW74_05905, partial [Campylobacterales bacterium]
LNNEIDKALNEYASKGGGKGGNRPDAKLLLQDKNLDYYPILIKYKGVKNKLVKLDSNNQVENMTSKNEPHYTNIKSYTVNGADWNKSAPIDTKPTLDDFKKTVSDYLSWEVSNILKGQNQGK